MSTSFSQDGRTALFHACWEGMTAVTQELLHVQADANIPSQVGLSLGYPTPGFPRMLMSSLSPSVWPHTTHHSYEKGTQGGG